MTKKSPSFGAFLKFELSHAEKDAFLEALERVKTAENYYWSQAECLRQMVLEWTRAANEQYPE